ncbi:ATP-binding protein [Nocardioides acrostichi]|uniref:ATP-binding protein n=1 Tax=Nocardioides acrostichi TaxID=2784339 RepID=A0A930V5I5_9ACTN|nr:ATP-binding protein [Nocardioides acrostichi]MBF4163564.1 ATP-binding protein [Nocardioides acrostichi]
MRRSLHLEHKPASVAAARRQLRDFLHEAGIAEPLSFEASLVLSELVTNAVEHGAPDASGGVHVVLALVDHHLTLDVSDGGAGHPEARDANAFDDSGRGLLLIAEMCTEWHVDHAAGTRVVAEMELAAA